MKRIIVLILVFALITGCSTAPVITASTLPTSLKSEHPTQTPLGAPPSPMPSQLGCSTAPASALSTDLPSLKIENPEPGPGRPIGIFATAYGPYIYQVGFVNVDVVDRGTSTHSDIYRTDSSTNSRTKIRSTPDDSWITQIFTDDVGNLFYVLYDEGIDKGSLDYYYLFEYNEVKDILIYSPVDDVVKIDNQFIYYYHSWDDNGAEWKLCSISLSDYKQTIVENPNDIPICCDSDYSITWEKDSDSCTAHIVNSYSKQTNDCRISDKEIISNEIYSSYVDNGYLYFVVNDDDYINPKSYIYSVNISNGKISKHKTKGDISSCRYFEGKIYFFFYEKYINGSEGIGDLSKAAIKSYNVKTGKIVTIRSLGTMDGESTTVIDIAGGKIWLCDISLGDETYCESPYSINIK